MKRWIVVSFQKEGFHRWAEAPPERDYLRSMHRHLFKVKCWLRLSDGPTAGGAMSPMKDLTEDLRDSPREVEFHDFLEFCEGCFHVQQGWSCEMAAESLAARISNHFNRSTTVEVWEDGECGAVVAID